MATDTSFQNPVEVIAQSPLFDAGWYVQTYPDAAGFPGGAVEHYLQFGGQLRRDPGPDFSAREYLSQYPEVADAGHNPLWHYELFGRAEGRQVFPALPYAGMADDTIGVAPATDATASLAALKDVFEQVQVARPHRFMRTFDRSVIAPFVSNLLAQTDAHLVARATKASVIMPTRNRLGTVEQAVRSVLAQSHHNLELIVIDDASTDGTREVLTDAIDDPRMRLLDGHAGGVSAARNVGLEAATGDVIFYLDSDNRWLPNYMRLMLIALEVSGAACGYAAARLHRADGSIHGFRGEPFDWDHCLVANYVDLNVFCHKRALYEAEGGFDPVLRRMVDWDLVLRYARRERPIYCPFFGCIYSDEEDDSSRISRSQPYAYHEVVSQKNAQGHASAAETIKTLHFRVAVKVIDGEAADVLTFAKALEDQGYSVRLDGPDAWTVRHAHQDDVVLILEGAEAFVPHSEQITFAVGAEVPGADGRYSTTEEALEHLTEDVRQGLMQGTFGK